MTAPIAIHQCRYVLAVQDLARSVAFYRDQLGLKTLWTDAGWHALQRGAFSVMLGACPDEPAAGELGDHAYVGYIEVRGIDALYEEYRSKDVDMLREITTHPWGQRDFPVRTVDGHRFMFGEAV